MARILFYPVARQLWISISLLVLLINCGGAPESAAISTSAIPTLGSTETGPLPTVPAPVTTPTASSKNDSPALRWLKGTPCQAPCWEQLTPGSSTITDTTIRLSQLDSIANIQYAPEQNSDPALIAWQLKPRRDGTRGMATLYGYAGTGKSHLLEYLLSDYWRQECQVQEPRLVRVVIEVHRLGALESKGAVYATAEACIAFSGIAEQLGILSERAYARSASSVTVAFSAGFVGRNLRQVRLQHLDS